MFESSVWLLSYIEPEYLLQCQGNSLKVGSFVLRNLFVIAGARSIRSGKMLPRKQNAKIMRLFFLLRRSIRLMSKIDINTSVFD